jgi:hypothetical protein
MSRVWRRTCSLASTPDSRAQNTTHWAAFPKMAK